MLSSRKSFCLHEDKIPAAFHYGKGWYNRVQTLVWQLCEMRPQKTPEPRSAPEPTGVAQTSGPQDRAQRCLQLAEVPLAGQQNCSRSTQG